jgi:hypothetical protein
MKKIIIGLLTLCSISSFGSSLDYLVEGTDYKIKVSLDDGQNVATLECLNELCEEEIELIANEETDPGTREILRSKKSTREGRREAREILRSKKSTREGRREAREILRSKN